MPAALSADGPLLVVGSFPPVPGPGTAATIEAVRQALAEGAVVRSASVRPSGAEVVARVSGPTAGLHLDRARRACGARSLLLVLDVGVPAGGGNAAMDALAIRSLSWALGRFARVTILVAVDPGVRPQLLAPLWQHAADVVVTADAAGVADALQIPAHLRRDGGRPTPLRAMAEGRITALGPPEVTPLAVPRYALGVGLRRLLGPRFPAVHRNALRTQHRLRALAGRAARAAGVR